MAQRIQLRRDTLANWTAANPVLAEGELALEKAGGGLFKAKVGDGVTAYNALGYGFQAETSGGGGFVEPTAVATAGTANSFSFDYSQGQHHFASFEGSAAGTIAVQKWPASGKSATMLLELTNAGLAPSITWPAAGKWVLANGTFSSSFAATGVTLQASGTDFVLLWTRDGGITVYMKVLR